MATETKTFYPQTHAGSTFTSISDPTNPVGKGSANTTSASLVIDRLGTEAIIYWPFDLSAVPDKATIDSVVCKAKCKVSSTYHLKSTYLQLFSGTTEKGSGTKVDSTSDHVYTLTVGTWTRDELSNCGLRIYSIHKYNAPKATVYFYGADLTVTYTYNSEKFMLKTGGTWCDVSRVFKKVSGIWVEQESLEGVVDTSKKLVNGGEIN